MADGDLVLDHERLVRIGVDHRQVLEIDARADGDRRVIAAQDRAVPDVRVLADGEVPDEDRALGR